MYGTLNEDKFLDSKLEIKVIELDLDKILTTVDQGKKRKIYIIGHDLGCFLGNSLARKSNFQINGIVNISGLDLQQFVSRSTSISQWFKSSYILIAQLSLVRTIIKTLFPKFFLEIIYNLGGVDRKDSIRNNTSKVFNPIIIYKLLFKRAFQLFFKMPIKIKTPTLFIWGKDDNFLNYPTMKEAKFFCTNSTIRIIPGGHWILRSSYDHVNRIIQHSISNWSSGVGNE